jgi:hypothetical protein
MSAFALVCVSLPSFAETTTPNAVTARIFAGPHEAGIGLGYSRDFQVPLRAGLSGGVFGAGDGSTNWLWLQVDARLLESSGKSFVVPALLIGAGAARFYDFQSPDGHDAYRETFAGTFGVTGELRPPQGASGGLIASLGLHAALALAQDVHSYPPYKTWASYRITPLAMLAIGYAF